MKAGWPQWIEEDDLLKLKQPLLVPTVAHSKAYQFCQAFSFTFSCLRRKPCCSCFKREGQRQARTNSWNFHLSHLQSYFYHYLLSFVVVVLFLFRGEMFLLFHHLEPISSCFFMDLDLPGILFDNLQFDLQSLFCLDPFLSLSNPTEKWVCACVCARTSMCAFVCVLGCVYILALWT